MSITVTTTTNSSNTLDTIIEGIKKGVQWLGRQIQAGWKFILPGLTVILDFFRTGFGLATLAFSTGIVLLTILQDTHAPGSCLNLLATRIILNVAAIACFVAAGVLCLSGTAVLL